MSTSIHKPDDSAPLHPIESVDDIVSVKHREQPLNRPRRVTRARGDVFTEDLPSVLDGTQHSILVGSIHASRHNATEPRFNWADGDSFRTQLVAEALDSLKQRRR